MYNDGEQIKANGKLNCAMIFNGESRQFIRINQSVQVNAMHDQLFARELKCLIAVKSCESFIDYLYQVGVKDIALSPGFKGAQILRRKSGEKMEITLTTYWDRHSAIKPCTGQKSAGAQMDPEEEIFELGPDLSVRHYEVLDHQFAPHLIR